MPDAGPGFSTSERPAVPSALRFRVFQRDGFACAYCGARPPWVRLEVEHVVAVSMGGQTVDYNLATACEQCNDGKGTRSLAGGQLHRRAVALTVDLAVEEMTYLEPLAWELSRADFGDDVALVEAALRRG